MKKIISVILIFSLAVIGCSCAAESNLNTENVECIGVPRILHFDSIEETKEFIQSVNLPDEEFKNFIEDHSYDMNGVDSKADVIKYCDILKDIPIICNEDIEFQYLGYTLDYDECYYVVNNSKGKILTFDFYFGEKNTDFLSEKYKTKEVKLSAKSKMIGKTFELPTDNYSKNIRSAFEININGYYIEYTSREMPEQAIKDLESFYIKTFREYFKQYAVAPAFAGEEEES